MVKEETELPEVAGAEAPTAEEIVEDEEVEAEQEEPEQEIQKIEKLEVKRKPGRPKRTDTSAQATAPTNRYVAFAQKEVTGIYDTQKKVVHSESQMEILAEILSKIDRIERSVA